MPDPERSPALAAIQPLDTAGCHDVLARNRLCTLSMVDGVDPYAVPLFYGFDGATLYVGIAEGRKTHVLDRNPAVCLLVVETGPHDAWASVQVTGRAEFLEGAERERGVRVLTEHNRRVKGLGSSGEAAAAGTASPEPLPRRHAGGRILRVRGPGVSGRFRR